MGPPMVPPPREPPPPAPRMWAFWLFVAVFVVLTAPWWCRPSW